MARFSPCKNLFVIILLLPSFAIGGDSDLQLKAQSDGLKKIIRQVEKRYSGTGFRARFFQESVLKAMNMTDTAVGVGYFRKPGKMRWDYEKPEKQSIMSDGETIWIYRPELNQVMVGQAKNFFGDAKGPEFLANMDLIAERFSISLSQETTTHYIIKLLPKKVKDEHIASILLSIAKPTYDLVKIIIQNPYGDETRISLSEIHLNQNFDDAFFRLIVPPKVDIIKLD